MYTEGTPLKRKDTKMSKLSEPCNAVGRSATAALAEFIVSFDLASVDDFTLGRACLLYTSDAADE